MHSHDIARQLLELPNAELVIQAGHLLREGDLANEVLDLSANLDGELCLEVGNSEVTSGWSDKTPII